MSQLVMRRPQLEQLPGMPLIESGYVLRTWESDDIEGMVGLLSQAFSNDAPWNTERVQEVFTDKGDVRRTFIIARDGEIVATASAQVRPEEADIGYVHWVAAHPDHSGRRFGYIVTLAALRELASLGFTTAALKTDDHRLAAITVYRQLGFTPHHNHETHAERWATIDAQLRPQMQK